MSHSKFHQAESFDQLPQHISEASGELVINDLRANTLKLLFKCIEAGMISGISTKDYNDLVSIYKMTPERLTSRTIDRFNNIINSLTVKPNQTIRILGNEVCHEGSNDFFTLRVLQKLKQAGAQIEIMLSPCSAEFLYAHQHLAKFDKSVFERQDRVKSMTNFQTLIDRSQVNQRTVKALVENYQSMLRLLSYAILPNQTDMVVYSHAPIGQNQLQALQIKYGLADAVSVKSIVDNSNQVLADRLNRGEIGQYLAAYRTIACSKGRMKPHDDIIAFMLLNQQAIASSNPSMHFVNTVHHEMPVIERAIVPYNKQQPVVESALPNVEDVLRLSPLEQRLFLSTMRTYMVQREILLACLDGLIPLIFEENIQLPLNQEASLNNAVIKIEEIDVDEAQLLQQNRQLANSHVPPVSQLSLNQEPSLGNTLVNKQVEVEELSDTSFMTCKRIVGAMVGGAFVGGAAYAIATGVYFSFFITGMIGPVIGAAVVLAVAYALFEAIKEKIISSYGPTLLQNDNEHPSFSI